MCGKANSSPEDIATEIEITASPQVQNERFVVTIF
jgi:hypothetical protein